MAPLATHKAGGFRALCTADVLGQPVQAKAFCLKAFAGGGFAAGAHQRRLHESVAEIAATGCSRSRLAAPIRDRDQPAGGRTRLPHRAVWLNGPCRERLTFRLTNGFRTKN